ncbi:tRNA uridine-5-carboxymethylaminomethyl(34) synthesis GTPase MnmE, partial [candidate division KSB1 bacterium]|nr:tRNA uridine-5-carboxymethylaminomethyl(34) synthesis GTPase MnmE [candidate division KSB1 bacterium]
IIRISGGKAIDIAALFCHCAVPLQRAKSWHAYLGKFYFPGKDFIDPKKRTYDQVLITLFRAPNSYTKEDIVEISCHGGEYIAESILMTLIQAGARLAKPGEFTLRAFMNGRIDLVQAEAVAELIKSQNDLALLNSNRQLEGYLSKMIQHFREKLIATISLLEIELDFAEEDLEFANRDKILELLNEIIQSIEKLIGSFSREKLVRQGVKVVLVGKPNVGKSSVLNAMLCENRAIVTDIPGTTRDILEETVNINGINFRLFDTAGIIESQDPVEIEGIRRTRMNIQDADILVMIFDGAKQLTSEDERIFQIIRQYIDSKKIVSVINKCDLPLVLDAIDFKEFDSKIELIKISALNFTGLTTLSSMLLNFLNDLKTKTNDDFVLTNIRHKNALEKGLSCIQHAKSSILNKLSGEFVVSDLKIALDYFGELTGIITSEEILNNIFSNFCIGK